MNLPSPLEVIKFWSSEKKDKKERLSKYLDSISEDATLMAEYWNTITGDFEKLLLNAEPVRADLSKLIPEEFERTVLNRDRISKELSALIPDIGIWATPNPPYHRLSMHYRALSGVIGGEVSDEFQGDVTNALAGVIQARQKLKDLLLSACMLLKSDAEFPASLGPQLQEAIDALNREAAALKRDGT